MGLLRLPRPTHDNFTDATSTSAITRSLRVLFATLLATLTFAGLLGGGASSVAAGQAATVVTEGAPLFSDLSQSSVSEWMSSGVRVDVLWGPQDGLYEIRYQGTDGWAWAGDLALDGASGSAASTSSSTGGGTGAATVATDDLSVRTSPDFDAGIYEYFAYGTSVTVVGGAENGYVPILYGDGTAWIYADYLNWDGSVAGVGGSTGTVSTASADTTTKSSANEGHWVDVNRQTGLVTLYDGDTVYAQYWGSLSYDQSDGGFYTTASGTYYVYRMYEDLAYTAYADAYIKYWVGFDQSRDNGFHSWTMDKNGKVLANGAGYTAGCVGLEPSQAKALYDFSYVGMKVVVHD